MTEQFERVDLVQAIAAVREQLKEAATQAAADDIQFEVEGLEIEFQVEIRHDDRVKAGAKAWVFNAGVEMGGSKSDSHRLKINLKPQRSTTGESVKISDDETSTGSDFPFS
ncbi:trypco2 family protein [Streptomyces sviceus]|uniref:trypco2 family protein n=1 Tax=Streptomyces sviceus TaxID=285530 RepID=UPI0037FA5866